MKQKIFPLWILTLLMLSIIPINTSTGDFGSWIIDGDTVYVDDEYVYLSAYPHTINSSGWVVFNLTSKTYSGDIDVIWGFDCDNVTPSNPQRFVNGVWVDWTVDYDVVEQNFQGMNRWYVFKELPIVQDTFYSVRAWMNIPFDGLNRSTGKYWWALKPSGETFQDAIDNEHLYALDPWWDSNWDRRFIVTIDHTKINNDLGDFTVAVEIPWSVGSYCNQGDSLRAIAPDNTTEYSFEREPSSWYTGGTNYMHVKVPTISSTSDTWFWVYYDNPGASDGQDVANAWNSSYDGVWHLDEDSGHFSDSALSTAHDSSSEIVEEYNVTGTIGGCPSFDGYRDMINISDHSDFTFSTNPISLSCFVYFDDSTKNSQFMWHSNNGPPPSTGKFEFLYTSNDKLTCQFDGGTYAISKDWNPSDDTWYHVAVTRIGSTFTLYVDGESIGTNIDATSFDDAGQKFQFGDRGYGDNYCLDGRMDEIRITNGVCYNSSWIKAEYYNGIGTLTTITEGDVYYKDVEPGQGATGIKVSPYGSPYTNATVWNNNDYDMNITFYSNSSGSWVAYGFYGNVANGTTLEVANSNFTGYSNIYYWNMSGNYGHGSENTSSSIYSFTTMNDPTPGNPTDVAETLGVGWLNMTWTNPVGVGTDKVTVVRKSGDYPSGPDDGVKLYNGTQEYYNDTSFLLNYYYTLYGFNTTYNLYSSGAVVTYGGLKINVYDENTSNAIDFYGVFISNFSGTETYIDGNNTNTVDIDKNDIPFGSKTIVIINKTSPVERYNNRVYYMDLYGNNQYTLNCYLPEETATELYLCTVIGEQGEYTSPNIDGAKVVVKREIGGTYRNVSVVYTDANGQFDIYLIPDVLYKFEISKDGYTTSLSDWIPSDSIFTHTFRILPDSISGTLDDYNLFWNSITFNVDMIDAGYLQLGNISVDYNDDGGTTINTQIHLYQSYHGDLIHVNSDSRTGSQSFSYIVSSINTSRTYLIKLYFNNSQSFEVSSPVVFSIWPIHNIEAHSFSFEERAESIAGYNLLGWFNVFCVALPLMVLVGLGVYNAGAGIVGSGLALGFTQLLAASWFTESVNFGLVVLCPLAIFVGIMWLWATNKGSGDKL